MATADIVSKSSETFVDKLKSTKRWATVIATLIPLIASMVTKQLDVSTGITLAVIALLTGLGIVGAEDVAKHLRDGKIAQAEAMSEHAKAIMTTPSVPTRPLDPR